MIAAAIAAASWMPASALAVHAQWPPEPRLGTLFVHYGEEHWDDADGARIFPKVIEESAKFRPAAVMTSSDKSSDGTPENLVRWRGFMEVYDRAGVPYFAAVGNHDRKHKELLPEGIDPTGDISAYLSVFAGRSYPFGDGPPVADPRFAPRQRPADDPPGASTNYFVDVANTRWVFLDNSCFSFVNCDPLQNPPFPNPAGDRGQLEMLSRTAGEAKAAGRRVFVVMHMPTQDPRPGHSQPTPSAHTMGEGASPENASFERAAGAAGVDGVFAGHIKGQWTYTAAGVPYFTDGGAGGEVYVGSSERTGVDYGYWHGFRLVHVADDGRVTTDAVPVFRDGSLEVDGPDRLAPGATQVFTGRGEQPTVAGPRVMLELREPASERPNRPNLPTPAHVWTTSDPDVLKPVAATNDDPRRVPDRQTVSGRFEAACPGRAAIVVTAGHTSAGRTVTVASREGPLLQSVRRAARAFRRGRTTRIATVSLAQKVRLHIRVRRRGRTIRTLVRSCRSAGSVPVRWNGNGSRRRARPGHYVIEVRVLSDRAPQVRRFAVRTRR